MTCLSVGGVRVVLCVVCVVCQVCDGEAQGKAHVCGKPSVGKACFLFAQQEKKYDTLREQGVALSAAKGGDVLYI